MPSDNRFTYRQPVSGYQTLTNVLRLRAHQAGSAGEAAFAELWQS